MFRSTLHFLACALLLGSCLRPLSALAEPVVEDSGASHGRELEDAKLGRAERKRKRGRAGVGFSVAGISVGAMFIGLGMAIRNSPPSTDFDEGSNWKSLVIGGAVLTGVGLAGLTPSTLALRRANQQIDELRNKPPSTTIRLNAVGLAIMHRF